MLAPGEERTIGSVPFETGPFLVVATSAKRGSPRRTRSIVGRTLETVTEATAAMVTVLAVAIPLLLLVVGLVTWRVVGRSLGTGGRRSAARSMRSPAPSFTAAFPTRREAMRSRGWRPR